MSMNTQVYEYACLWIYISVNTYLYEYMCLCVRVWYVVGKLRYGILEDTNLISIDALYGQIHLLKTIDKELISHLSFTVQAFDSGGHIVSHSLT